jgi:hypothetical protein
MSPFATGFNRPAPSDLRTEERTMYAKLKEFFNGLATDPQKLADYHLDRETALEKAGLTEEEKEVFRLDSGPPSGPGSPTCVSSVRVGNIIGREMKIDETGARAIHIHIYQK